MADEQSEPKKHHGRHDQERCEGEGEKGIWMRRVESMPCVISTYSTRKTKP
jgi:hypothetical protein